MTDPLPSSTCPDCGELLPPESPQSLCPACLMRQALASRTITRDGDQAPHLPPLSPEEIADRFPGYEILECLGRGGMGAVYKARQKSLNRLVAIKILAPQRVGEGRFAERFTIEAELLARTKDSSKWNITVRNADPKLTSDQRQRVVGALWLFSKNGWWDGWSRMIPDLSGFPTPGNG